LAALRCRHPVSDPDPTPSALAALGPAAAALPQYRLSLEPNDEGGGMMYAPPLVVSVEPKSSADENAELLAVRLSVAAEGRLRGFLGGVGFDAGEAQRVLAIWPFGRAAYWARAVVALAWCVDGAERARGNPEVLTPLLDTTEPVSSEAVHAIALAHAGKASDARAAAVDATIQTIADGRLDGETLGETTAWWVCPGIVRCGRLAAPWADVARESELHCAVMRRAAECLVAALAADPPRDLHALLEVWLEWCVSQRAAVGAPAARRVLEQFTGSGKSARLARNLLALEPDDARAMNAAGAAAIRARLIRAERVSRDTGSVG
jgi:hypothetical protein